MIAVVDYGIGNLGSIANTINKLGFKFSITNDPEVIDKSKIIILPGVGSALEGMANIKKFNLDEINKWIEERSFAWKLGKYEKKVCP